MIVHNGVNFTPFLVFLPSGIGVAVFRFSRLRAYAWVSFGEKVAFAFRCATLINEAPGLCGAVRRVQSQWKAVKGTG